MQPAGALLAAIEVAGLHTLRLHQVLSLWSVAQYPPLP